MQNTAKVSVEVYLKGIGMLVGMMFGAGIFALPFVFSQAGLFWGTVHFIIAFLIMLFLTFLYAEVAYFTRGRHRFTGYVEIFLGKRAKQIAFLATLAAYYGTLLVYGLLGGLFISNFFNGAYKFEISLLFFAICAFLLLLKMGKIAEINFYLTIPLFGFIFYLLFVALPAINAGNFVSSINFDFSGAWFLPYGVWIFALGVFATLPEARDIFSKSPIRDFKRVILISFFLSALFYFLFIFAVWGVGNTSTTPDALSGLFDVLGRKAFLIGSFIGFLAVFTSFLAMAVDMKNIFKLDYKISKRFAWLLTVIPPAGLFLFGADDFVKILGIIGAVGLGTLGVFIISMARKLRKKIKEGDPEHILKPTNGEYMRPKRFLQGLVLIGILAGVIYELWRIFS